MLSLSDLDRGLLDSAIEAIQARDARLLKSGVDNPRMLVLGFESSRGVELDAAVAIARAGELEAKDLGVLFGLLEAFIRHLVLGFGLDYGDGDVGRAAEACSLRACLGDGGPSGRRR